jgi:acetyl esterase/lipase
MQLLPPTTLVCGDFDPFLDDTVDLASAMHRAGRPVRMAIVRHAPHGFLHFNVVLAQAAEAGDLVARAIVAQTHADARRGPEHATSASDEERERYAHERE